MNQVSRICLALLLIASANVAIATEKGRGFAILPPSYSFDRDVAPLLEIYCIRCHGPKKSKADLRIDRLNPDLLKGPDAEHWEEVLNNLQIGDMPPEDEKQPLAEERDLITAWLNAKLRHAAEVKRSTGGSSVLRRLTRYEYTNTMRDLLGIDLDFAENLPPEAAAEEGFVNNYSVLGTSALHMEYFQRIGINALRHTLLFGDRPEPFVMELGPGEIELSMSRLQAGEIKGTIRNKKGAAKTKGPVLLLPADAGLIPTILLRMAGLPLAGPIRVTVRAAAVNASEGIAPRIHVEFGYDGKSKAFPVELVASKDVTSPELRDYVFDVRAEALPFGPPTRTKPQVLRITNPFDRGTASVDQSQVPGLRIESIRVEGPFHPVWPPETRIRILGEKVADGDIDTHVPDILKRFMFRAYRRPASVVEVDRMHRLYQALRSRKISPKEALTQTLSAVLCSPGFLLIAEPFSDDLKNEKARPLNDFELASRLSYFLWNSMPDKPLFTLARAGKLRDPKVLIQQVDRMLKHEKAQSFFTQFTTQWFGLDGIYSIAINPEYFPNFKEELKGEMIAETIAFFSRLVEENRSALELIDSDYAMLNADLARHYGIPGVPGDELRPISLKTANHRGGVLTHASVLTRNSSGDDTHPIKRGVWLLERLLDDPPPPPPPAVPNLAETESNGKGLSLKAKLKMHRNQESCNTCHRKIDPWGVAFENYDGIGRWRESTGDTATLVLPKTPLKAPQLDVPANASERVVKFTRDVNRELVGIQRAHNLLRKLGFDEPDKKTTLRILRNIETRKASLNNAFEGLAKETGENISVFRESFGEAHQDVLDSNSRVLKAVAQFSEVDPKTRFADGVEIADLDGLKRYILEDRREQFTQTVVRKLMAYALGRYLDFTDTDTVNNIHAQFVADEYRMRGLVKSIVISPPFLTK